MTWKAKISKPGFNVLTETNPDNLIFSSDYNTLKYYASGNNNVSLNGNGSTQRAQVTIVHNLGYIPFFECFVNSGSNYFVIPRTENTASPNTFLYASAYADTTNLYLVLQINWAMGNNAVVNYAWKIYKNNLGF